MGRYVAHIGDTRNYCRILIQNLRGRRHLGRNVRMGSREVGGIIGTKFILCLLTSVCLSVCVLEQRMHRFWLNLILKSFTKSWRSNSLTCNNFYAHFEFRAQIHSVTTTSRIIRKRCFNCFRIMSQQLQTIQNKLLGLDCVEIRLKVILLV
jgi:hypothetical protein